MTRLNSEHHRISNFDFRLARRGLVPRSQERVKLTEGTKEHLGALALDIFTQASNHGQVFQEALLAVYLSGLNHGAAILSDGELQ